LFDHLHLFVLTLIASDNDKSILTNVSARRKVANKAYEIINRNFTAELQRKEAEIESLDSMLLQVQKALHLVRYAAVSNLYTGPNITGTTGQVRKNAELYVYFNQFSLIQKLIVKGVCLRLC
jgi:hypothetical protein